jgi:hypothetical protein
MKKKTLKAQESFYNSFGSRLRGRRMIVCDTPENAVRTGVNHFLPHGFCVRPCNMGDILSQEGSLWSAQALEIGERIGAGRGLVKGILAETPLALVPFFKMDIPPTLVIITARSLPDGTSELIVQPITSRSQGLGHFLADDSSRDNSDLAAPRVNAAVESMIDSYQQAGCLIKADKPQHYVRVTQDNSNKIDEDCPAFVRKARSLTGFK